MRKLKSIASIFVLSIILCSCATPPGPNLTSKALLIYPQTSTKGEVLLILGPPVQIFLLPDGKEEWYYYYRVRNFWENIPYVRGEKGLDYTEVLKITFEGEKVFEVVYYTVEHPAKKRR